MVKDSDENAYLIIECKTAGSEYEKELKNMQNDGGQLFSYFWQEKNAKFLCLYASDFTGEPSYQNAIISVIDDDEMISRDKISLTYQNAKNAKECVKAWQETYKKEFHTNGIFEAEILPYEIFAKAKSYDDLVEFEQNGNGVYNKFATILRKHNISGKENAFDKLVNLFLCKIYDELHNQNELKFIYRPRVDSFEDLQDRLMQLYQKAMGKFLGENITFVSKDDINHAFVGKKSLNSLKSEISEFIRQLKFYSNNDFAFLEVHNKELFYQNALVLVEVVKLFENHKLTQNKTNQFLGNLFELFLQKGMKQDEGQFFTPIQICEFMIYALPIQNTLKTEPKLIDFACGAGHFLNTYANFIKNFISDEKLLKTHYAQIYGIEKEYRLSKVAKVSSAMYGQEQIQIAYFDALCGYEFANPSKDKQSKINIKNNDFDILIANPPYSVKGFLKTLSENSRKTYELFNQNALNIDNNDSIECFFIERANQLLKQNAIAAIILPSSILNKAGIFEQTREILLKNFSIKAVVELGSNTFGATGTNTIILFMQKRKSYKNDSLNSQIFKDLSDRVWAENLADNSEFDTNYLGAYCEFVGYEMAEFKEFLNGVLKPNLQNHSNFKEYFASFLASNIYKNLTNSKEYKTGDYEEQEILKNKAFLGFCGEIEKQKLLYFALCKDENVLIIKAPSDNKEEKKFLGYEWSNRKGAEGLKELNTPYLSPLFERENFDNSNKIAYFIRQSFLGVYPAIPSELEKYAFRANLIDLINFNSSEFNKAISLNPANSSSGGTVNLWENCKNCEIKTFGEITKSEGKGKRPASFSNPSGAYPFIKSSQIWEKCDEYDFDTEAIVIGDGGSANIHYLNGKFSSSDHTYIFTKKGDTLLKFLYFLINANLEILENGFKGIALKNVSKTYITSMQIPLPPLEIQKQIVDECEKVEKEYQKIRMSIEEYRNLIKAVLEKCGVISSAGGGIAELLDFITDADLKAQISSLPTPPKTGWEMIKLGNKDYLITNPSKKEISNLDENTKVSFVDMASVSDDGYIAKKVDKIYKEIKKGSYTYFAENDILIAKITPCMENGKCAIAKNLTNEIGMGSSEFHIFRVKNKLNSKFLFEFLNRDYIRRKAAENMTGASGHRRVPISFYENLQIPLPPLKDQEKIVSVIENLENKIEKFKSDLNALASKNQEILKKYLF